MPHHAFRRALSPLLVAALISFFGATAAHAAQVGQIVNPNAPLLSTPGPRGQVIENLGQDVKVSISNQPTQGYYRARTAAGNIGWIASADVQVIAPGGGAPSNAATASGDSGGNTGPTPSPPASGARRGGTPAASAGTDKPIATGSFSLELGAAYSDQVGLGLGAGFFTRLGNPNSWHVFELGLQGTFYAFNAATPVEVTPSFRYWVGRDGVELGVEVFGGALMLLNATGLPDGASTLSIVYGPGFMFSLGLANGIRFYAGFRQDLSNTMGRYGRGGLVFYL